MKIEFGEADQAVVKPRNDDRAQLRDDSPMTSTPPRAPVANWLSDSRRRMAPPPRAVSPKPEPEFQESDSFFQQNQAEERKVFVHYYDVDDEEDDPESVDAPASANPSELSQVPDEPSNRKRSNEDVDNGFEYETGEDNTECGGSGQPAKKAKTTASGEKIPWALTQNASHIPLPAVRLNTSYSTIALMAHAIREELTCRKTLRKRNPANGNYCVVCLDYRKDSGLCEHFHNNQQDVFEKYWHTMFGTERISKQNLLVQLLEMQKIEDPLPPKTSRVIGLLP